MMIGTIRKRGNSFVIEYQYPATAEPVWIGVRWTIVDSRRTGPFAPALTIGTEVRYANDPIDRVLWQAYAQGDYLKVWTERDGTPMDAEPIPCPKVRKGIDTRYYCGRWEKYSKREGWIAA